MEIKFFTTLKNNKGKEYKIILSDHDEFKDYLPTENDLKDHLLACDELIKRGELKYSPPIKVMVNKDVFEAIKNNFKKYVVGRIVLNHTFIDVFIEGSNRVYVQIINKEKITE